MEVMDCYVAIADMMKYMISSQHIYVSTRRQYMYSPSLLEYLHQVTPVKEYDFSTGRKEIEEKPMNERWNIVEKERKDRDSQPNARAKIKQRLTRKDPPKNYSTFDLGNEEEEEKEEAQDEIVEDKVVEDAIEAEVTVLDEEEDVISM
jgi:hypothetical protein